MACSEGATNETGNKASQIHGLRDRHRSLDAGGKRSSAASPYSADRRGSSGPHTRSDDKGVCADVGRMAYVWGWPLVYVYNQRTELTKAPETVSSPASCRLVR